MKRSKDRKDTRNCNTVAFAKRVWGIKLESSFLSKFHKRHHLSLKIPAKSNKTEYDATAVQDGAAFISHIRRLRRDPEQIVVLDKTNLYSDTRFKKHASPMGG